MKRCPDCKTIEPIYVNQCSMVVCKCGRFEQIDGVIFQYDEKGQLVRASRAKGWWD